MGWSFQGGGTALSGACSEKPESRSTETQGTDYREAETMKDKVMPVPRRR